MDDILKKWRKQGTAQLLKRLESPRNLTPDDLAAIKQVLKDRDKLAKDLTDTLEDDVTETLQQYNLDWSIQLRPLCAEISDGEGKYVQHPRLWWPVRMDTGLMLGRNACDEDKPVLQNRDLVELGLRLAHATGASVKNCLVLNDGASVMMTIQMTGTVSVGQDVLTRYLYLLDNRTSEHGLRIGFGDTVLRCGNQLRMVSSTASIKMKHTKTLGQRLAALVEAYDGLQGEMDDHNRHLRYWATIPAADDMIEDLVMHLTGIDLTADETGQRRPSPKQVLADALFATINDECRQVGQTMWGVLNGITLVATHKRHLLYPVAPMPELDHDLTYGQAGKLQTAAYEWLRQILPAPETSEE